MKLAIYHNVIAPYKVPLFKAICENWSGEVLLYTSSEIRNARPEWGEQSISADNLDIRHLPGISAPGIGWYNPTLFPRLLSADFDVLMTGDYHFLSSVLATHAAVIRDKPCVLYTVATRRSNVCNPDKSTLHRYLNTVLQYGTGRAPIIYRTLTKYDAYITPSETSITHLTNNGVDRELINQIYNPVDTQKFAPERGRESRYRQLTTGTGPVLCFVGRLVPEKGLEYLLGALAVCETDVTVLVAGDGPSKAKLHEQATEYGVSQDVHFLGHVPHRQIPEVHAVADGFVLPSVPTSSNVEQFPNALLEAMASGLPGVTFDIEGGIKEIHNDGITGTKASNITVDSLASAVDRLFSSDYKVFSANAREKIVQEFAPEIIGQQFVATLEQAERASHSR